MYYEVADSDSCWYRVAAFYTHASPGLHNIIENGGWGGKGIWKKLILGGLMNHIRIRPHQLATLLIPLGHELAVAPILLATSSNALLMVTWSCLWQTVSRITHTPHNTVLHYNPHRMYATVCDTIWLHNQFMWLITHVLAGFFRGVSISNNNYINFYTAVHLDFLFQNITHTLYNVICMHNIVSQTAISISPPPPQLKKPEV